jgi:RHS repeat-associated protein
MKTAKMMILAAVFFMASISLSAQNAPICDSGGVCGPNPTDPSYSGGGGIVAARPQKQNARGTRNATVAMWGGPGVVPRPIGSQSYNKTIPILSLPGRGLDLNLNLYYNSRVWTLDTAASSISFNADRDFPAYGFRLDFGYIEYDAATPQMIVTESDGTKHDLPLTANTSNGSIYDSNDGTFMEFNNQSLVLTYRDGTMVTYQPFPSASTLFRPIQIMDTNRNFITIRYVSGAGNDQHINTITDTLGRVIQFNYNGSNQLASITQSPVSATTDPSGTHTWATFGWSTTTLTYSFVSTLSVVGTPATGSAINVLTTCTYPNGTSYRFSYGAWGIINRIDLLSAPIGQNSPFTRSYESYNFPGTSAALNDAPAYTQQTISPDGSSTSVWNFAVTESGPGQVTGETITDPLGTATIFTLNSDGTLSSKQIKDSSGKLFLQKSYIWNVVGGSAMMNSIATTDDAGNTATVSYGHDTSGNITDLKEFDFNNTLLRETVTTYKGSPFTGQHILNLPGSIQVKDGSGTIKARTDFDYDTVARVTNGITTLVQNDGNSTVSRGNLTLSTRYSDPVNLGGPIVRQNTYDILGNLVIAQEDSSKQKTFNFDPATQYAYLSSTVRGPNSGPQFTTTFTYNPDNGVILSKTDENAQATSYQYDNMYRTFKITTPPSNGQTVTQTMSYVDTGATPQVTITTTANSTKVVKAFDGLGHLTRQDISDASTGTTISTTQFQYDAIWRRKATSNPYAPGDTVLWNNTSYDVLNRVTSVSPATGGSTQSNFVGNTVLMTDPDNKQRKNYLDPLGRLIRVDEPGWGDALAAIDSISISGSERSRLVSTRYCAQYTIGNPPRCVDWEFDTSTDYDTGSVTANINGVAYKYTYGQNDSSSTIATNLAGKINADPARVVNASPSGATINLYAVNPGASGNSISVSASSVTTDTVDFTAGSTSFPVSTFTPTFSGGENAVSQQNAVITATRHLTTTYGYDVFDNLVSVSQGAIGPINGQQLSGQTRSYSYDALNRLTASTTPESGTATSYYTDSTGTTCSGNPSLVCRNIDARGVTKNFSYDGINRLSGVTFTSDPANTPTVVYHYDAGGQTVFALDRLTGLNDGANSATFAYDNLGRNSSVTYTIDGASYPVHYAYNAASQLTSLTYPSGRIVKPDYDAVGRLNHIVDANTPNNPYLTINSADYSGAGQVKQTTYGNGVNGQFTYNDHLQISTLRYSNPSAPAGTPDVLNLSYDYTGTSQANNNGQIQAIHYFTTPGVEDQTKSQSFNYDAWSRLSQAQTLNLSSSGTWQLQWGYDRLGNRTSQTLTAGNLPNGIGQSSFIIDPATNRITNSGFQYDNTGNMTHDATAAYTYDGANRLTTVNNGTAIAAYTYVGPLRIKKSAGGAATVYIYSGSRPIAEYVNGQVSAEYVYSGSRLLATLAGGTITYHHPDHLSNRAETNASGAVTRTFAHFPFGETWYEGPGSDKWNFTSYERDNGLGETGLDYAVFRQYASGQGRFMNADLLGGSIGMPQSGNRYSYALNDPINSLDLWGLCTGFIGRDKDGTPIFGERPCHKAQDGDDSDGGSGSGGGGGSDGGGGGGGCAGPCSGGGGGGGGGGTDKDKKKNKENKQDSQECKDAQENLRHVLEEEHHEAQASGHALGRDVAIGAGFFCGIQGIPAALALGPEAGGVACLDGAIEGAVVGAGIWGVGALWDSFQASRAQAKAQQDVDAKCH